MKLLVLPALAVLAVACDLGVDVGSNKPLFVRNALLPPTPSSGGLCAYTADPAQPALPTATLDVAIATRYVAELLVGNQGDGMIEVQGATVVIADAVGTQLNTYTYLVSQTVPGASGGAPAYASLAIQAVDPDTVSEFLGSAGVPTLPPGDSVVAVGSEETLVATISVYGATSSGSLVTSDAFELPITLCAGCLVRGLVDDVCASTPSADDTPCIVGQDQPVNCSLCSGSPICDCGALRCDTAPQEPIADAGGGRDG